ncbi:hypothetical protein MAPG_07845 [Magnaporthiopsis poae ATCC 64411]|uniref:Uncharacterized protein n=1 Tax=Magnaporthiopsis poae (strain ATCC 64411 / 73-15) TaxID=644358 RepID=A0A0C4CSH7_MAGP6|nr:hypothetical protein, variant [Magnaporthiopsis poae ATCC 64411]KLU88864.1 hypothetical protein MAPG_07845 [Magnaporthiopsis poae ATCC 64411]
MTRPKFYVTSKSALERSQQTAADGGRLAMEADLGLCVISRAGTKEREDYSTQRATHSQPHGPLKTTVSFLLPRWCHYGLCIMAKQGREHRRGVREPPIAQSGPTRRRTVGRGTSQQQRCKIHPLLFDHPFSHGLPWQVWQNKNNDTRRGAVSGMRRSAVHASFWLDPAGNGSSAFNDAPRNAASPIFVSVELHVERIRKVQAS